MGKCNKIGSDRAKNSLVSSEHWHFAATTQEALWITSHKEKRQSDIVSFSP